jgi:vancomycin resistance protein VanW
MPGFWENSKKPLRNTLKQSKAYLHGFPFSYARTQDPERAQRYGFAWGESRTPIPARGTDEIRANRLWNLRLAAERIHGLRLAPREIFSFFDRVGAPTGANGFREAPVFSRGRVTTDAGGGLCLVATNLFIAFLRSGCEILERHCHSIDAYGESRFYELGQDAAVAYGYKDLVVRNSTDTAVQVRLGILGDRGEVVSSLWGERPRRLGVTITSTILREIPPERAGDLPGWVVETVRSVQSGAGDPPRWRPDFRTMSRYAPCRKS